MRPFCMLTTFIRPSWYASVTSPPAPLIATHEILPTPAAALREDPLSTLVTRARVREAIGAFDLSLIGGQDLDWMLRIARTRRLGFARVPVVYFRGRPGGTEDALQLRRIRFDRKVFFRHAVPEWRIWGSPLEFAKAHNNTLGHFYRYFSEAAAERAAAGQRGYALRTALTAVSILPFRAAGDLFRTSALRRALHAATVGARP